MTQDIPAQYEWLLKEGAPQILVEALNNYGVVEGAGDANNPLILEWAKELNGWIGEWYTQDSVPWCGLFVAICAKRAGFGFNQKALSAREWVNWGQPVTDAMLGDVLVFQRPEGGHVGLYAGEDGECFHVLGGNQHDMVCITRVDKSRLIAARRCQWKIDQPANVRRIWLAADGAISGNEA